MHKALNEAQLFGVLGGLSKMKSKTIISTLIITVFLSLSINAQRPKVYTKEEPIKVDFDMESIEQPESIETGYLYDFIDGTLFQPVRRNLDIQRRFRRITGKKKEAINVNVLDEVPDSSWYTNRIGTREFSIEEIKQASNVNPKPRSGKLVVLRGKTVGATPGFWVRDEKRSDFYIKIRPEKLPRTFIWCRNGRYKNILGIWL